MRNFLATVALVAILIGVGFYAAGWVKYHRGAGNATIEIETQQIENAAQRATEQGRDLLEEVIEQPVLKPDPTPAPASKSELEEPVT